MISAAVDTKGPEWILKTQTILLVHYNCPIIKSLTRLRCIQNLAISVLALSLMMSCSATTADTDSGESKANSLTTTTADDPAATFRKEYEQDEATFRTKLFAGEYFLTAEEVGNLVSDAGLYGQYGIDDPKGRITATERTVCDSLSVDDLVNLARPVKAASAQYQIALSDEVYTKLSNSDKSLVFNAEVAAFDIPREQSLESLARRVSDELALSGGECTSIAGSWDWEACSPIWESLTTPKIPGWYQHSDLVEKGCVLEPSGIELSATVDKVPDLYFPKQFFVLTTPTVNSDYRNVSAYWFLPAEWLGVMFYVETTLLLWNGAPFSSTSPSVAEVIDRASSVFKNFKDQFVSRLSRTEDLPKYEDLFVRQSVVTSTG